MSNLDFKILAALCFLDDSLDRESIQRKENQDKCIEKAKAINEVTKNIQLKRSKS